jgi:tRNA threonylcarbamoyladenosine biosynthesis protein TsaB
VSNLILAVDTTGNPGSIALVSESGVIEEVQMDSPEGFSQMLIGEIDALLKRTGVNVKDIAAFASASGPGSFTGVRIGLTAVKGLAQATGRPAAAISNLRALASFGAGDLRAVALDARRDEIYGAVYNAALECVQEEVVTRLDAWLVQLPLGVSFVVPVSLSDADRLIASALPQTRITMAPRVIAGAIGKIALDRLQRGLLQDAAEIDANYVRRSDAELFWKDPHAGSPVS